MDSTQSEEVSQKSDHSRHISEKESLLLWVRSGGRCAHCNEYLLEEPNWETPLNLGERAHNVGWNDTPGSPRGQSALPLAERNKADNLLLLCQKCHTIVDAKETRENFPVDRLQAIKLDHEERIRHLTGMGVDRQTAVLRVFGAVRGSTPEMARETAARTVVDVAGKYAKFPFAPDRRSMEVDLFGVPEPEKLGDAAAMYWKVGRDTIDSAMQAVAMHVRGSHIRHISVFAVARIPLLVYLGYALDDKIPTDIYQKQRGGNEDWSWPNDQPDSAFGYKELQNAESVTDVAIILSISGTIPLGDLPDVTSSMSIYEIQPVGQSPNPNIFRSQATLDAFSHTWQELLSDLEVCHKQAQRIHLFLAVPISAAISCGRLTMRDVHPAIVVYDRIGNDLQPTLIFNERSIG